MARCGWRVAPSERNGYVAASQTHYSVHAVETLDGEHVADLCEACGEQLELGWDCVDCQWIEVTRFNDSQPQFVRGRACLAHAY